MKRKASPKVSTSAKKVAIKREVPESPVEPPPRPITEIDIGNISALDEIKSHPFLRMRTGRMFEVQKILGEGVFGLVYEVVNKKKERLAAKVMKTSNEPADLWKIELIILEKLSKKPHENILQMISSGTCLNPPPYCSRNVIFLPVVGPTLLDIIDSE
ncbi:hypothetical protein CRE_27850 [Caenorhabditis remanei]|uniref:Protein kinase domain-containing protein n=1 Tax=Caenorhabditis remanei TaxID=31234 RepID=E3NDK1_CAERE|nr:hypothetical protein CRE_27850 [Caenorhabditis remanei]